MSYWNQNPELYTEIIFKQMVHEGLAKEEEDVEKVVGGFLKQPDSWELAIRAEQEYWGSMVDKAMMRMENKYDI